MNSIISFNGDNNIPQPATLKEEVIRKVFDKTSINGTTRRTWMADKKQATLTFTGVDIDNYNLIAAYIFNQANPLVYANSKTGWNFTGFVTSGVDQFLPGSSWLRNLTIVILEV